MNNYGRVSALKICIILAIISVVAMALAMRFSYDSGRQLGYQTQGVQQQQRGNWLNIDKTEVKPVQIAAYSGISISPPHSCKNMTLFVVSRKTLAKGPEMITLEEGLADKSVEVSEKDQAQVNQLCIENKSNKPLFLQIGDVVKGGQQDRTIQASVIVPPHSGRIPVPSLCVESGRWQGEQQFAYAAENGVPDKNMRMAVNSGQQGAVWAGVANYKANVNIQYNTSGGVVRASKTSSLNEEMEDPKIKAACAEYEKAFSGILNQYPDAIGVAYVLNGEINTIDIFQTNSLFRKTYVRLIKAYANESVLNQSKAATKTVTADDIVKFMTQMEKGKGQEQKIHDNEVIRLENEKGMAAELKDKSGESVHRQYIKK